MNFREIAADLDLDDKIAIRKALVLLNQTSFFSRVMEERSKNLLQLALAAGDSESKKVLDRAVADFQVWNEVISALRDFDSFN